MTQNTVSVDVTPSSTSTTWTYGDDAASNGDITITGDSDITFKLKNASGWNWASPPLTFEDPASNGDFSTPTIDPQNANKFSLNDSDADGSPAGTGHEYCLHATYNNVTYKTDPRFINR